MSALQLLRNPAFCMIKRRTFAREIGAGADADAFFFAAQRHMFETRIFFNRPNELQHFFVRQGRDKVDARFFESGDDGGGGSFGGRWISIVFSNIK